MNFQQNFNNEILLIAEFKNSIIIYTSISYIILKLNYSFY